MYILVLQTYMISSLKLVLNFTTLSGEYKTTTTTISYIQVRLFDS